MKKLFTANKGDVIHSSDDTLIKVHHIGKHGEVHYIAYADGARGRIQNEPYYNYYGKIHECYQASIGEKEWLENWIKKEEVKNELQNEDEM